jgi:hypothetical protein
LFLFDDEELSVVTSKLLERDEEITKVESELIVLRVKREQAFDKACDLVPVYLLA